LYLSFAVEKPVSYFFLKEFRDELDEKDLSDEEKEFLMLVRKMNRSELKQALKVVKALLGDK
jgi:hypothetical protein